ncbi:hypothetical protein PMIN06_006564 [Paraphaeosphaeria minitans]
MPLLLESCTPHDIPSLVALSADAFSAPTPTNVFLDTPAVHAFRIKRLRHTFARDPWAVFTKAVDTALPADAQVVAFAKWTRPHSRALGEEEGAGGYVDLEGVKERMAVSVIGERPFWYLQVLATHPAHGGRGCAGKLVNWGMQRAEEEGVECYVEAQDSSKPIFLKYGWEEVGVLGDGDEKWATVLVYNPAKQTNIECPTYCIGKAMKKKLPGWAIYIQVEEWCKALR